MFQSLLYLLVGSAMLYFGAEWIVKSGSHLATRLGVPTLVVGLTVVAFGTSLPELIVSIVAALEGSSAIAIGTVVGSNIANVGLVLGLSSLIFPITIHFPDIRRDFYIYLGVCFLFLMFVFDGRLSRFEGLFLFTCLIFFVLMCLKYPNGIAPDVDKNRDESRLKIFMMFSGGIVILGFGADLFVDGAKYLAHLFGISEVVIGMTVVAFGTSLPELATSSIAAFRRESGISIGNIVGSNLFNILSVLGLSSMITPLDSPRSILTMEIPFMIAYGLVLILIGKLPQPISRFVSVLLIVGYLIFLYLLF